MPLTKVTTSGITDSSITTSKIADGTIVAADITAGTITADKLNSTLDLSSKTVTLPNTSVTNAQLAGSIANSKLANSTLTINGSSVSLGSSISAGALNWQVVQTTGFTAVAGRGYFCNTTSTAFTVTLPATPTIGDTVALVDYAGTFATNKLTIARNGSNIQGVANNSLIGTNRASITLVYVDSTKGWIYQDESNVADLQQALFISATGGTVLTNGNFKTHVFTGDGCFVVSTLGNPAGGPSNVDYLVVAGGAGGGGTIGGGGGAGGYRTTFPSPGCNAGSFPISSTTYPITVGSGGSCATSGSNSIFSTITSTGGGAGSSGSGGTPGGSGGGGGYAGGSGGTGNTPPVSPSQGNNGGTGQGGAEPSGNNVGGGGGGIAASGGNATPGNQTAGSGGIGSPISPTFFGPTSPSYGTPGPAPGRYFAGGGGGGARNQQLGGGGVSAAAGGSGGGGAGAPGNANGTNGTANTGGGGGGAGFTIGAGGGSGSLGGKGIVVIRYKFQ